MEGALPVDTDRIWHNFLKYRYGNLSEAIMSGEDAGADKNQSLWWSWEQH